MLVLSTVNESDELLTLLDLLSALDRILSELELFAIAEQACITIQSLNSTSELFQSLCITPEDLAFESSGCVRFMDPSARQQPPESMYVPPEYEQNGNTVKSHIFSLGMTLLFASEYKHDFSDNEELEKNARTRALNNILSSMISDEVLLRCDVSSVLNHCRQSLCNADSRQILSKLVLCCRPQSTVPFSGRSSACWAGGVASTRGAGAEEARYLQGERDSSGAPLSDALTNPLYPSAFVSLATKFKPIVLTNQTPLLAPAHKPSTPVVGADTAEYKSFLARRLERVKQQISTQKALTVEDIERDAGSWRPGEAGGNGAVVNAAATGVACTTGVAAGMRSRKAAAPTLTGSVQAKQTSLKFQLTYSPSSNSYRLIPVGAPADSVTIVVPPAPVGRRAPTNQKRRAPTAPSQLPLPSHHDDALSSDDADDDSHLMAARSAGTTHTASLSPCSTKDSGIHTGSDSVVDRRHSDFSDDPPDKALVDKIAKILRDEFAFDGFLDDGVQDVAMSRSVLALALANGEPGAFARAVQRRYDDLFWSSALLASVHSLACDHPPAGRRSADFNHPDPPASAAPSAGLPSSQSRPLSASAEHLYETVGKGADCDGDQSSGWADPLKGGWDEPNRGHTNGVAGRGLSAAANPGHGDVQPRTDELQVARRLLLRHPLRRAHSVSLAQSADLATWQRQLRNEVHQLTDSLPKQQDLLESKIAEVAETLLFELRLRNKTVNLWNSIYSSMPHKVPIKQQQVLASLFVEMEESERKLSVLYNTWKQLQVSLAGSRDVPLDSCRWITALQVKSCATAIEWPGAPAAPGALEQQLGIKLFDGSTDGATSTPTLYSGTTNGLVSLLFSSDAFDKSYVYHFLLTFRYMMTTRDLLRRLQLVYIAALRLLSNALTPRDQSVCGNLLKIKARSIDVLYLWLRRFYEVDFHADRALSDELKQFVNLKVCDGESMDRSELLLLLDQLERECGTAPTATRPPVGAAWGAAERPAPSASPRGAPPDAHTALDRIVFAASYTRDSKMLPAWSSVFSHSFKRSPSVPQSLLLSSLPPAGITCLNGLNHNLSQLNCIDDSLASAPDNPLLIGSEPPSADQSAAGSADSKSTNQNSVLSRWSVQLLADHLNCMMLAHLGQVDCVHFMDTRAHRLQLDWDLDLNVRMESDAAQGGDSVGTEASGGGSKAGEGSRGAGGRSASVAIYSRQRRSLFRQPHYGDRRPLVELVRFSQKLTHWIAAELLSSTSEKVQLARLVKLIQLMDCAAANHDFATLMAVYFGLQSLHVRQITAWRHLPSNCLKALESVANLSTEVRSSASFYSALLSRQRQGFDAQLLKFTVDPLTLLWHVQRLEEGPSALPTGHVKWTKLRGVAEVVDQVRAGRELSRLRCSCAHSAEMAADLTGRIEALWRLDLRLLAAHNAPVNYPAFSSVAAASGFALLGAGRPQCERPRGLLAKLRATVFKR